MRNVEGVAFNKQFIADVHLPARCDGAGLPFRQGLVSAAAPDFWTAG